MKSTEQILREQILELERLLELKTAHIVELQAQLSRTFIMPNTGYIPCQKCVGLTACMCKVNCVTTQKV